MKFTDTPPEQLGERELFTEFVELIDEHDGPSGGYSTARRRARHANLLAEIGERLETLEAAKSIIGDDPGHGGHSRSEQPAGRELDE